MSAYFRYLPTPEVLQWLAAGKLAHRLGRSLRLWVLLQGLYGPEPNSWELSQVFEYKDVRSRLFSENHPTSDRLTIQQVVRQCHARACICQKTGLDLLKSAIASEDIPQWQQQVRQIAAWTPKQLQEELQQRPFATVHRSIRDDLKHLGKLGWLRVISEGQYQQHPSDRWPILPGVERNANFSELSKQETWKLLRVLESVAFVQPSLELTVQSLWEQLSNNTSISLQADNEPQRRIFLHLDYILSPETQDQVDTYQEQIEQLWRNPEAGVIQFETWIPAAEKKVVVTVYPVCLHYLQRAKYLSAYGINGEGLLGWHNYRLDRIVSERITGLVGLRQNLS
ncbi:MAG: TIGR03985 family CRISPR-associated protein [Actinomycetota bacterium]